MKIIGLVIALIVSIDCCAAATSRTSMWLAANTQIFTAGSTNSQSCYIAPAPSVVLLKTTNLLITGTTANPNYAGTVIPHLVSLGLYCHTIRMSRDIPMESDPNVPIFDFFGSPNVPGDFVNVGEFYSSLSHLNYVNLLFLSKLIISFI